jgi:hypothetical protein
MRKFLSQRAGRRDGPAPYLWLSSFQLLIDEAISPVDIRYAVTCMITRDYTFSVTLHGHDRNRQMVTRWSWSRPVPLSCYTECSRAQIQLLMRHSCIGQSQRLSIGEVPQTVPQLEESSLV